MARQRAKSRYLDPEVLQKIGSLELVAREAVEGLRVGMHKSPLRGFSTEFVHHRPYVPGDALRHLDWRVYGRTERYYIKLYEAETNFDAYLLLDASHSMRYGSGPITKLEYAKYMAASLAYVVLEQRDSVGLGIFDSELRTYLEPSSQMGVIHNIDEGLQAVEGEPKTDLAPILHQFAGQITRRGFIMVFSDLFDDPDRFLRGLDHLRFRGHNVAVFQVLDPYELTFPMRGTWLFEGLENDGQITTQPARIRQAYLAVANEAISRVKRACDRSHVDYLLVDTSRPLDAVLAAYLLKRKRTASKTI